MDFNGHRTLPDNNGVKVEAGLKALRLSDGAGRAAFVLDIRMTFSVPTFSVQPDKMIVHIANMSDSAWKSGLHLWLPPDPGARAARPAAFFSPEAFNGRAVIPQ